MPVNLNCVSRMTDVHIFQDLLYSQERQVFENHVSESEKPWEYAKYKSNCVSGGRGKHHHINILSPLRKHYLRKWTIIPVSPKPTKMNMKNNPPRNGLRIKYTGTPLNNSDDPSSEFDLEPMNQKLLYSRLFLPRTISSMIKARMTPALIATHGHKVHSGSSSMHLVAK